MEETGLDRGEECCKSEEMDCSGGVIFNFVSDPPSLENISLVCIAISLCGNPDLTKYRSDSLNKITKNLEKNMFGKLAEISLPDPLKVKIANTIRPIGLQLKQFFSSHLGKICAEENSYFWTMEGTIDKVRSLKEIINCTKNLSNKKEYFNSLCWMACDFCLEDCISYTWLEDQKRDFYWTLNVNYDHHIIAYWISVKEEKLSSLITQLKQHDGLDIYDSNLSICENMVALSALQGNEISFKYFWNKLTENQKISGLDKWLMLALKRPRRTTRYKFNYQYYEAHTDIMCVLLSHLSQKKQEEILQTDSGNILLSLFHHWPLQRFFLPTITAMFHFLQEDVYIRILSVITFEIKERRKTEFLLRKLWHLSPLRFKKAFVHSLTRNSVIIMHLISVNEVVTIDMILFYASSAEKKQIIFNMPDFLTDLLYEDVTATISRMDALVSKALPSVLDVVDFKRLLKSECADVLCHKWLCQNNIEAIEKLLDWIFQSENEIHEYKIKNINPLTIYRSLIHSSDCAPAECFLNWYFDTEEEILQFKNTFVHGGECSDCEKLLLSFSQEGQVGWDKFEQFLSYGYISSEEMIELKRYLSLSSETAKLYIDNRAFEFATLFLHWCLDSSDEINRFKSEVLLSKVVFMRSLRGNPKPNWEKVKNMLKWFAPISKEVIVELKSVLVRDELEENDPVNFILFDLFNSFSEEHQMPENEKIINQ